VNDSNDTDRAVDEFFQALRAGDGPGVRLILHPYLLWSEGETTLRGRNSVLARLADPPEPGSPESVELRDGQIYRWFG